jgi:D-alanine transaminase
MATVYLNGEYLPEDEARVSVNDRGFMLADGVYEVTPVYGGKLFLYDRHQTRLERGLRDVRIDYDRSGLAEVHDRLIAANGLSDADTAMVYLQVTRGVAPRTHPFPDPPVPPTVYAFAKAWQRPSREQWEKGIRTITAPDNRWLRVDIKTIQLLPNALAMQAAADAHAQNAIFIRDGVVTEGGHANLFAVLDGTLTTHPANHLILHGITRALVLELAQTLGLSVQERPFTDEELFAADEVFLTGTTAEISPVVAVDGSPVGNGRVGAMTRQLRAAFMEAVEG